MSGLRLAPSALTGLVVFASLLVVPPARAAESPAEARVPGQTYLDRDKFIEWQFGDLPIVLTAAHGGHLKPKHVRSRTDGVLGADVNTQELTRAIAAEFLRRTGRPPHLILALLHRSKLDANREIDEAAQGDPLAQKAWHHFHTGVRTSLQHATEAHGFAFIIDIHGHAHPTEWIELGYGIGTRDLNRPDASLDSAAVATTSTLNDLAAAKPTRSFAELLRGPRSLGALLVAHGYRSVPSPSDPGPKSARYFNGGYIVRAYGRDMPRVDGVQIEAHFKGVRATPAEREAFARALVDAVLTFLAEHYGYAPRAKQP